MNYSNKHITIFDRRQQVLTNTIEVSKGALDRSRVSADQVVDLGSQMTTSSQQLEELAQTIQQTIRDVAIAEKSPG